MDIALTYDIVICFPSRTYFQRIATHFFEFAFKKEKLDNAEELLLFKWYFLRWFSLFFISMCLLVSLLESLHLFCDFVPNSTHDFFLVSKWIIMHYNQKLYFSSSERCLVYPFWNERTSLLINLWSNSWIVCEIVIFFRLFNFSKVLQER